MSQKNSGRETHEKLLLSSWTEISFLTQEGLRLSGYKLQCSLFFSSRHSTFLLRSFFSIWKASIFPIEVAAGSPWPNAQKIKPDNKKYQHGNNILLPAHTHCWDAWDKLQPSTDTGCQYLKEMKNVHCINNKYMEYKLLLFYKMEVSGRLFAGMKYVYACHSMLMGRLKELNVCSWAK